LSEQGRREERRVETKTRKRAKEMAEQVFVTHAIAIGRSGDRPHALSDSAPERAAYTHLHDALEARWRKRKLEQLVWDPREPKGFDRVALREIRAGAKAGWRAAWKVTDVAQDARHQEWLERRQQAIKSGRRRPGFRPDRGPDHGDQDLWAVHLGPNAVAVAYHWTWTGSRDFYGGYGAKAVSNAEVLLRALIGTELELGARPEEPVFICLALANPWSSDGTVFVESWSHVGLNPREWRSEALEAAGRKMHLEPPPEFRRRIR
jgi:hypothetical protein